MSWQKNAVLPVTFGQDEQAADPQEDTTTESTILRYIKTLTKHHMNAKQQRMDQYLQQVKHLQSPEDVSVKLAQSPSPALKRQCQQLQKKPMSKAKSRHKDSTQKGSSNQEQRAAAPKESRSRSKRPYDKSREDRQLKKPKQAQQTNTIGSLDQFRLHGAWSQKSASRLWEDHRSNKTTQDITARAGNKPIQSAKTRRLQPGSPEFSTICIDLERRFLQELEPLSVEAHTAPVPTQDPCSSLSRLPSFLSPEDVLPTNRSCVLVQQEDYIPTYDPLTTIMESIYF